MVQPHEQLDRRFDELRPLMELAVRPPRGWLRAVRDALGMTTAQLARRIGVSQPRVTELEQGEVQGVVTLRSLERAAEALGCRFVYAVIPITPLGMAIERRAIDLADQQLAAVEQTMRLEAQGVSGKARHDEARAQLVAALLRRPARLWDSP